MASLPIVDEASIRTYVSDKFDGVDVEVGSQEGGAPEIACQAYDVPAGIDVTLTAGQTVLVVIDPVFTSFTDYELTVEKK